jgi:hypothetical protein
MKMNVDRAVFAFAGVMILASLLLTYYASDLRCVVAPPGSISSPHTEQRSSLAAPSRNVSDTAISYAEPHAERRVSKIAQPENALSRVWG